MATINQALGRFLRRSQARTAAVSPEEATTVGSALVQPVEIAPNDPLLTYLQSSSGAVDIDSLTLDSPAVTALRENGMKLIVPLVNQGELIGLLNLGPRLSEQEYSADDRRLLENLAGHVAPAVMVAQLVRQQEAEARTRERFEQELRVAQLIQQNFLPREAPDLPDWRLAAYYQPAREVGGDFYDFINLDDGRFGLVIGDVTDKGVPAALVMAATRSVIRATAQRLDSPAAVLQQVNDVLCPDMPPNMFVTCQYSILDPVSGRLVYANAGHNLPYLHTAGEALELRATGMPLGLLPGMGYDDKEVTIPLGGSVLFHSDGLAEAHSPAHEMFGFPRLKEMVALHGGGPDLIDTLRRDLAAFTGREREQEDDVTLVTLTRAGATATSTGGDEALLDEFSIPSQPGNERLAIERVAKAVAKAGLDPARVERMKTAVGEATMNAMEHGNGYKAEVPVLIRVAVEAGSLVVCVSDAAGDQPIPEAPTPDLDAKLAGLQTPRGWGLFLIKNMVDDLRTKSDGERHTIELVFNLSSDDGLTTEPAGGEGAGDA
jgi:serine phosphatase RsbU (regulator of sigma subunit)/anti-sigma regulatory factor (Ser/Thr protein kinase)